jgi:predicted ATPase/DNA-binding SARP family transcriptional activator
MTLNVKLLGGFETTVDGIVVPDSAWRLKKARELVKLLALARGHRLHRDQALDVLWRELAPAAAANNLHQAVHVARRALGAEAIDVRDEVLSLAPGVAVDVDLLELAAGDARRMKTPAAYRAALSLYGGELLPENRYDDWAELRREELAELAAGLAQEAEALGAAAPFALPAEASSFVGRERELAELDSLLRHTRVLTLSGTGGVGKTRLALQLARSVDTSYESGAALVELASVADPRLVLDAIATALDVRPLPAQELVAAVIDFLARRQLLLVLDNCEHVLSATAALVDTLLRAAPQLTILATSREPLRVAGEVVFRVPSLDIPDPERPLPLQELLDYESVSLFVARAVAASPQFELNEQNAEDVSRICLRLDGLPLALELAAARLGALSPAAIATRLDDRFRLLRSGSRAAPTRQQTLTATLQWSHDLLEPDEQVLLRRLAVFAGGFELEAAEQVCAGEALDAPGVADTLARLVEKSLVTVEDRGNRRRYRLLETVRMYARGRLEEAGEAALLADGHARWALALAQRRRASPRLDLDAANLRVALDLLLARDPPAALALCVALSTFWLRRIELEEARRRFAVALAAAPQLTPLRTEALLAAAAIDFRSGTLAHGMELAEQSRAAAVEIGDERAQWRALQFLGELGVASDDTDVAVPWLEQALALARAEHLPAAEAIGIHSLGIVRWMRGDLENADRLLAESVEAFRALEGSPEKVPSPLNIAEIRTTRPGSRPGLQHVFQDTLKPFVEISCEAATSYALANQAGNARARGDTVKAAALLDESAARFEAAGDDAGLATVFVRRAYAAFVSADLATAQEQLEAALALRTRLGDRRGRGLVISGLGMVETVAGDYPAAELHLADARDIFRRAGDRWGLASSLWRTADLAIARDDLDAADAALREAFAVLGETQRERWLANTLSGLAEVALLRGDAEQASAFFAEARMRYAARDDDVSVASIDERLASLQSDR